MGFPSGFNSKEFASNAGYTGDMGLIPGLGRFPREENDYVLQYSCLKNFMDRGAYSAWGRKELDTTEQLTQYGFHPDTL